MTTREIQEHLKEIYQIEVSPTLISDVTSAVIEDAKTRQNRPLERFYPFVFLDALVRFILQDFQVGQELLALLDNNSYPRGNCLD